MLHVDSSEKGKKMTPLDIGEIIFVSIVVIISVIGFVKVAIFSNDDK